MQLKYINLDAMTKLNDSTYTAKNGTILQITKDHPIAACPWMFKTITTSGKTEYTRCEIQAARNLK